MWPSAVLVAIFVRLSWVIVGSRYWKNSRQREASKFFIDDGNLSAPFTKMTETLVYVFDEGPEVGYHLKRTKGVYLLGRCEDRTEAVRRKLALIARFHFDPAIGGRFFCARTRVRIFFCGRNFFFRGRECARTVLERKTKIVRAQLGTQIIFVRSRAANVLDMPSVSESPEVFRNHESTSGLH